MTPAPGTPHLSTCFAQSYSCTTCDTDNLDRYDDLYEDTWTCNDCGKSVHIVMVDAQRQASG